MRYFRTGDTYCIRLDRGEEIVGELTAFCNIEQITLGFVTGIGATDRVTLGFFNTAEKQYHATELVGDHEILHLSGNITTLKGEAYLHLHITLADQEHRVWGGHLNTAQVSATAEVFITTLDGLCERARDEIIGLNLMQPGGGN
jgi:hypothetical protein